MTCTVMCQWLRSNLLSACILSFLLYAVSISILLVLVCILIRKLCSRFSGYYSDINEPLIGNRKETTWLKLSLIGLSICYTITCILAFTTGRDGIELFVDITFFMVMRSTIHGDRTSQDFIRDAPYSRLSLLIAKLPVLGIICLEFYIVFSLLSSLDLYDVLYFVCLPLSLGLDDVVYFAFVLLSLIFGVAALVVELIQLKCARDGLKEIKVENI
ncbi:hypothetical protein V6N13_095270 [Hibiscus sabdariffa]|uniref:Uncharacterized protein n=1 Tax=Hibiscus sabdariffa TaxID=183260 RepID=A0ABR2PS86_9ROSI